LFSSPLPYNYNILRRLKSRRFQEKTVNVYINEHSTFSGFCLKKYKCELTPPSVAKLSKRILPHLLRGGVMRLQYLSPNGAEKLPSQIPPEPSEWGKKTRGGVHRDQVTGFRV